MTAKRKTRFSDQLRQAICQSGLSRYEICKQTGLDQAVMHRFVHETSGLSITTIDTICECLGLRLVAESKPARKRPTKGR